MPPTLGYDGRRRVLSTPAATGAVSAGVGVGTDALFSDAESFDGARDDERRMADAPARRRGAGL